MARRIYNEGKDPKAIKNGAVLIAKDANNEDGKSVLQVVPENQSEALILAPILIKSTTGDTTAVFEGLIQINTYDNTLKMYADGGWRSMATSW